MREYSEALDLIRLKKYSAVCIDFGGTLIDFAPLHIRGFLKVLKLSEDGDAARTVASQVRADVVRGVDSYAMMASIARQVGLPQDLDVGVLVIKKRALVEEFMKDLALPQAACNFVNSLITRARVSVVSLGLVSSMEAVIQRSIGEPANLIRIYGRRSLDARLDKKGLVATALLDSGVSCKDFVYVGDAIVDQEIAGSIGVEGIRLQPFEA